MEELHVYRSTNDLPPHFEWQIRTFSRLLWFNENEDDPNEPLTPEELHPVYFVLAKEKSLISYARIISTTVDYLGNVYKMYGLGDVFTFPEYRNKGCGTRVVASATNYIRADPAADAAILLTEPDLESFYKSVSWEPIPELTLLTGEPDDRRIRDDFVMMLFLSEQAKQDRADFQNQSVFLPGDEW